MLSLQLASIVAILSYGKSTALPHLDDRIVGGTPTTIEEYPYQVSVENSGRHSCGGSLISADFVITAGHCTYDATYYNLAVRVGSTTRERGGQLVPVKDVHSHPLFNITIFDYDISILRLEKSLDFTAAIMPIPMVSNKAKIDPTTVFTVTGWGTLSEGGVLPAQLQVVKVPYVENEKCQGSYEDAAITDRMICAGTYAGDKDSCQGDSGGPLVANGLLVGVVSWGYGCAKPDYPGVYSRLAELREFVREVTLI